MVPLEEYLQVPCRNLSIPYWKQACVSVPKGMQIVHEEDFDARCLETYTDTPYFRLLHDLRGVRCRPVAGFQLLTADNFIEKAGCIKTGRPVARPAAIGVIAKYETPLCPPPVQRCARLFA